MIGDVANEVETEQILCEPNTGGLIDQNFSSFTQVRGRFVAFSHYFISHV